MKRIKPLLATLLAFVILTGANCNKSKDPLDQLPPETQTGAGTFGCLINGQVFTPKRTLSSSNLTCYYQYLYSGSQGYAFQVAAGRNLSNCESLVVSIDGDSVKLEKNKTFLLGKVSKGFFFGKYTYSPACTVPYRYYTTYTISSGELHITSFDEAKQILSGTFWFNAASSLSDTVKVTNGRFDVKFTR